MPITTYIPIYTDEDKAKLPKWAQKYIGRLQERVTELESQVAEMSSVHEGSNVAIDGFSSQPDVTLPPGSQIIFYLGEVRKGFRSDTIRVRHLRLRNGPGTLYVQSDNGSPVIIPQASNSFHLRTEK